MLAPAALLRSSVKASRRCVRLAPKTCQQQQRRAGHGHHNENLTHLERPAISPQTFSILGSAPAGSLEAVQEYYSDAYNNGEWIVKFINSTTALKCLAEINGTEFHHPLKASVLVQVYKEQFNNFQTHVSAALEKEGLPKKTIEHLHYIYSTRAHVDEWEVDAAIKRFSFLGKKQATYRVVTSASELWPAWKARNPALFLGNDKARHQFLASEQAFGQFPASNEAAAVLNVVKFRGVVAFVNAVMRGLTPEERQKIRAVLVQPHLPMRLEEQEKAAIDAFLAQIKALREQSPKEAGKKVENALKNFGPDEKLYFYSQVKSMFPQALKPHDKDGHHHHGSEAGAFLEEGVDYFSSEKDRLGAIEQLKKYFYDIFDQNYKHAKKTGDAETKKFADKFKSALAAFFAPDVQGDVELLALMRGAELSERKLEDIFSIFRTPNDTANQEILMDAINPHPVSVRLFGERLRVLSRDNVQYTKTFHDGADSVWTREGHWPAGAEAALQHDTFKAPPLPPNSYNTAMDEVLHLKLKRLATDFYGLNLETDVGLATFDQLVHTFDLSPGEETLDRTHPSPPDHHTYVELPIIKFDGWDECDELPPKSEIESLDAAVIEARINEWLAAVAKSQGTEVKTVKQLASSTIDPVQLAKLRSVLTYETDKERLILMKKIWGVVLPEQTLTLLFRENEEKLLASETHH